MAQTAADDVAEQVLDKAVDQTPVLLLDPDTDQLMLHRFVEDVAQKIHGYTEIAARYGFGSAKHMAEFIASTEEVRRRIKIRRAIWESDGNAESRVRAYATQGIMEALPETLAILHDKSVGTANRLEALKTHAKLAGMDSTPQGKDSGGVPAGGRFSINFVFRNAGTAEQITTVGKGPPTIEAVVE